MRGFQRGKVSPDSRFTKEVLAAGQKGMEKVKGRAGQRHVREERGAQVRRPGLEGFQGVARKLQVGGTRHPQSSPW